MNIDLAKMILGLLVRHGLSALAGYGLIASRDTESFLVSALALVITLAWSGAQKYLHHQQLS